MPDYGYCESVTATSISPWCIRVLTTKGRKLGGGIDTASLCGRVKPHQGWDLSVKVDPGKQPVGVCPRCAKALQDLLSSPG